MKKLFLSIFLFLGITATFAQKSNVSQANNLTMQEKPDFAGARAAIKSAIENDQTKNDPKTLFTAGMIGFTENEAFNKLLFINQPVDDMKKGKAIMESLDYFIKANDLDQLPDSKGKVKPKFTKKIKENIKEYYKQQYNIIRYGAHLFDKKDYKGAADVFDTFLSIPKLPLMQNEIPTNDSTYHMIQYFAGLSATNLQDHPKAISVYNDLKNANYETKNVYQLLAEEYRMSNDTVNQLATLEKGFQLFKDDPWFLQNIINHYIYSNKVEAASKYLDAAIAQAPTVPEYHYVKGNVDERLGNLDVARKSFEKAIELKPDFADAYEGIGRLIFNQGVEILKGADTIKDKKLYDQQVDKATELFKQTQTYFEKAVELNPKDKDFKQTLKMLYYRLGMNDKYDAISKEIDNM